MTSVLGIDPANLSGFAHSDGYREAIQITRANESHPGQRLMRFANVLGEILEKHKTDQIAAEDASFGSPNPSVQAQHNELRGIIYLVAAEFGIPVKLFVPKTIKLFATGDGNADKSRMIRAAKVHYGLTILSEDEADAFWAMKLWFRPDCWPEKKAKKPRRPRFLPPQRTKRQRGLSF